MSIGVKALTLREVRERAGLSQNALAQKAGITIQTISRIENGLPTKESTIEKICKIIGVSRNDITGVTINPYRPRLRRK